MRTRALSGLVACLFLSLAACGGSAPPPEDSAAKAAASGPEARWLRGLWAKDVATELAKIAVKCGDARIENKASVWDCDAATPLTTYKIQIYGSAPAKIEYIHAVVTQSGGAKDEIPLRLFGVLAGLHFEGADPARARAWVESSFAAGGTTTIGPAKYKLAGDVTRRVLDIKASGSDW